VTVALSGDGGDENFAGYRRYFFDRFENRVRARVPGALRGAVFGTLGAIYPGAAWLPQRLRAKTLLKNLARSPLEGYFTSLTHVHPAMKENLFSGDLKRSLAGYQSLSVFEDHWKNCKSRDPLSRVQYLDFKTYLVDDILVKVDRASMAHSLEVRVPILDHKVVELAARMPSGWKLDGKISKHIFKEALKPVVPPFVFDRRKSGFSIPIAHWFRKDIKEFAHAKLFGAGGASSLGLFEKAGLVKLWDEHQSGARNHSFPLFSILSFSLWHGKFIAK
jgi:asparagine synthase (glutamine-hydrolysing)